MWAHSLTQDLPPSRVGVVLLWNMGRICYDFIFTQYWVYILGHILIIFTAYSAYSAGGRVWENMLNMTPICQNMNFRIFSNFGPVGCLYWICERKEQNIQYLKFFEYCKNISPISYQYDLNMKWIWKWMYFFEKCEILLPNSSAYLYGYSGHIRTHSVLGGGHWIFSNMPQYVRIYIFNIFWRISVNMLKYA